MAKTIAVIRGDGIGPEVVDSAIEALNALNLGLKYIDIDAGYGHFLKTGETIAVESIEACRKADAILYGANTNPPDAPQYKSLTLMMRKQLDLFANIRPSKSYPIPNIRQNVDLVVVRENTEGMYAQIEEETEDGVIAKRVITRKASERILRKAFELAMKRRKKVTIVHKANVLKLSCGLFRNIGFELAKEYPEVKTEEMFVDAMAMNLIRKPEDYDIIVTTNLFGDILSDEASALVGGLGMAAAANIGEKYAMFEPVHGSAPKYAGKNAANPVATILSAGMMLEYLGYFTESEKIENAVHNTLKSGQYTKDLGGTLGTREITQEIIRRLR